MRPRVETKEEKLEVEEYSLFTPLSKEASLSVVKPVKLVSTSGGAREWYIPIGSATNLSTNGSGLISAALSVSTVAALSNFTSLATMFDEFFVESVDIWYQPQTRYQVLPSTSSTEFNGTPLGIASLFLDTSSYTNINQMPANPTFALAHTSSPFKYTWRNNVKRKTATSVEPTSTQASLGWVRTNATPAQYYGGTVQFVGSASSAMHASTVCGVIAYKFNVWFRAKA